MSRQGAFTLGTRGSLLALRQTQIILEELQRQHPGREFALKVITTRGDRAQEVPLTQLRGEGVFVKELEATLLAGDIDMAVHSLKDLPTGTTPGLTLAALPPRGEVRDALVCPQGYTLDRLPPGSRLGTGSPRRGAQIRALRPELEVVPIRGNLDTRLRKAEAGQYDAIVVAAVGMERLGLAERITQYLPLEACLPAVGQGALAVQVRAGDRESLSLAAALDHLPTRREVAAERAFLEALGGGCRIPMAALGQARDDLLELHGLVAREDGSRLLRSKLQGDASQPEELGQALARRLLEMGAAELVGEMTR